MTLADPLVWTIRGYQRLISRYMPPMCRFHPSCSRYAVTAILTHGLWKGAALAAWRVLRCNPLFEGGIDPVPTLVGTAASRGRPSLLPGDPQACACSGGTSHDE